jgi:subtilisin family serine protease
VKLKKFFIATTVSAAFLTATATALQPLAVATPTAPTGPSATTDAEYIVLYKGAKADAAAKKAIAKAGGTITKENNKVGYAYVKTRNTKFAQALNASGKVQGAAKERIVGQDRKLVRSRASEIERMKVEKAATKGDVQADAQASAAELTEPLANRQWDMRQIGATATGSYATNPGKKTVRVGIIDTGIDGTHPDIAPNFDANLSRNFTTDMPDIDGACEHPSCVDPANEDDDGHGTHVAATVGAAINGIGIAGVAPNVTLINIRAGQDSGYFFLQSTLDALTYAGDIGVDVVNMSYYTDPWLYNCLHNPADTPEQQQEQRVIRQATQRALNYARYRGVLPISALGNEATDLGNPTTDDSSPDYPADAPYLRTVDNSCLNVPAESNGVVSVSSTGPSGRKAYYSNYGTEQTDLSAPGGDVYDTTTNNRDITATILAAYPKNVADAEGTLNPDGTPNTPSVIRDCKGDVCGYYQYLQGTSMAAPHAVGVAALVVSRYGKTDRLNDGVTLSAADTQKYLYRSAQQRACPQPRTLHYTRYLLDGTVAQADATCAGPVAKNGFYGRGIVNAYKAVHAKLG